MKPNQPKLEMGVVSFQSFLRVLFFTWKTVFGQSWLTGKDVFSRRGFSLGFYFECARENIWFGRSTGDYIGCTYLVADKVNQRFALIRMSLF